VAAGSGWLVSLDDRCNERLAALIEDCRPWLLLTFAQRVQTAFNLAAENRPFLELAMVTAADVITDVTNSVRAAAVRIDDRNLPYAWAISRAGNEEGLSPADGLTVGMTLLSILLAALTSYVTTDPALMPCFTIATTALNESISRRMQAVANAWDANVLDRIHRAQTDERRRIARDLHDRVGEALSVGVRRLDLLEMNGPAEPPDRDRIARKALVEAMRRIRVVTSDLREPPVQSLEKALISYLESVHADAEVQLRVSGDEAWVPPAVLDEAFLIVREAVRNALKHGNPRLVLIGVELSPRELTAWVIDDGGGFDPAEVAGRTAGGTGLPSMRERAALIGGRLTVSSMPYHGMVGPAHRADAGGQGVAGPFAAQLASLSADERDRVLRTLVQSRVALVLGLNSPGAVEPDRTFRALGFTSLAALELRNELGFATGLPLPASLAFDYPTPDALAGYLRQCLAAEDSGDRAALKELDHLEALLSGVAADGGGRSRIVTRLEGMVADFRRGSRDNADGYRELADAGDDEIFNLIDKELGV
jgi:signal transduction histidine kinase